MRKLDKAEKVVLVGGGIALILLLGLGLMKSEYEGDKKITYKEPTVKNVDTEEETIKLKEETFTVEAKSKLNTDASTYVEASEEALKEVEIDFDNVDVNKIGSYIAQLTYKTTFKDIPIEVVDTKPPVITVATTKIEFLIAPESDINEIKKVADASAEDAVDGVIMEISGWPSKKPSKAGTETYTLTAVDKSGNKGTKDITVIYKLKEK